MKNGLRQAQAPPMKNEGKNEKEKLRKVKTP
jgi:hypothetical protein